MIQKIRGKYIFNFCPSKIGNKLKENTKQNVLFYFLRRQTKTWTGDTIKSLKNYSHKCFCDISSKKWKQIYFDCFDKKPQL